MSDAARLKVAIQHRVGGMALDVAFRLTAPWTVLFAPSGAGKSTVLRVIAGLVRPDAGRVVAGEVLVDTAAGVFVLAHRRRVPMVAQRAAVFPHLSVAGNVSYGAPGVDVSDVMEICRVGNLAEKMPAMLSGGEMQRVALARALAAAPGCRVLLLDEAFNGFDTELRDAVIGDVQVWLAAQDVPVLQVTHDVGEVFAAGGEVVRMVGGRVVAQGLAADVLALERERLLMRLGGQ